MAEYINERTGTPITPPPPGANERQWTYDGTKYEILNITSSQTAQPIKENNYGFQIPSTATINGVEVTVDGSQTDEVYTTCTESARLIINGTELGDTKSLTQTASDIVIPGNPVSGSSSKLPTSAVESDRGGASWNSEGYVRANDGRLAFSTNISGTHDTDWLIVSGFGFNIPSNATITGFKVTYECRCTRCTGDYIQLVKPNGTASSAKNGGVWPTSLSTKSVGSSTDKWGLSWTPSDVNNSNFKLRMYVKGVGGGYSAWIDYIQVTVYYTTPGPSQTVPGEVIVPSQIKFGGPTDKWGVSLTPDIINNSNFGVRFSVTGGYNGDSDLRFTKPKIKVYYSYDELPEDDPGFLSEKVGCGYSNYKNRLPQSISNPSTPGYFKTNKGAFIEVLTDEDTPEQGMNVLKISGLTNNEIVDNGYDFSPQIVTDTSNTISFYYKILPKEGSKAPSNVWVKAWRRINDQEEYDNLSVTGSWERYTYTFTGSSSTNQRIWLEIPSDVIGEVDLYICGFQLEQGASTTTWDEGDPKGEDENIACLPWSTPNDLNNCSVISSTVTLNANNKKSSSLIINNFGFNIPPTAIITGVEVKVKGRVSVSGNGYISASLTPNPDVTKTNHTPWDSTPQEYTIGGSSDNWGLNLTPDLVNSEGFGVILQAVNTYNGNLTFQFYCVTLRIYYRLGFVDLISEYELIDEDNTAYIGESKVIVYTFKNNSSVRATKTEITLNIPENINLEYVSSSAGFFKDNKIIIGEFNPNETVRVSVIVKGDTIGEYNVGATISCLQEDINTNTNTAVVPLIINDVDIPSDTIGFSYGGEHSSKWGVEYIRDLKRNLLAPIKNEAADIPGVDGEIPYLVDKKSKTIKVEFLVFGETLTELNDKLYAIARWLDVDRDKYHTPTVKPIIFDDAPFIVYYGYVDGEVEVTYDYTTARCSVTFYIPEPYAFNLYPTITGNEGENIGLQPVKPYIGILATDGEYLLIKEEYTGSIIQIDYKFNGGEIVEIDCENQMIYIDDRDARRFININSTFPKIPPGRYKFTSTNGHIEYIKFTPRRG